MDELVNRQPSLKVATPLILGLNSNQVDELWLWMSCYGVIIGCKDQNSFLYKAVNMLFYIVEVGHSVIQLQVAIRETGISFFFFTFLLLSSSPHTHTHPWRLQLLDQYLCYLYTLLLSLFQSCASASPTRLVFMRAGQLQQTVSHKHRVAAAKLRESEPSGRLVHYKWTQSITPSPSWVTATWMGTWCIVNPIKEMHSKSHSFPFKH